MIFENIPDMLKERQNWVVWGISEAAPKVPFSPDSILSGRMSAARAGIGRTWGRYQDAAECVALGLARGLGYEFDGDGLYGVDLDNVISKNVALTQEAQEIVGKLSSYTEVSPSGTGLHILVLAPGADITRHRKKDFFLEIYGEGRYFTVTGIVYRGAGRIETRTAELQSVHDEYLLPDTVRKDAAPPPQAFAQGADPEYFLRVGLGRDIVLASLWAGKRRIGNESSDDQALMNKLAYWCNADPDAMISAFISSPHYAQKDEAHRMKCHRPDYLPNTARNACATAYSTAAADSVRWQQKIKPEKALEKIIAR